MLFRLQPCYEGSECRRAIDVNFDICQAGFTKCNFLVNQAVTTAKIIKYYLLP